MAGRYSGIAGIRQHIGILCRRAVLCGGMILFCAAVSGCGGRSGEISQEPAGALNGSAEDAENGGTKDTDKSHAPFSPEGFYEIRSEKEVLFEADAATELILAQYYQGEPVQLRCSWGEDAELGIVADIYLYKEDGTGELLFAKIPDLVNKLTRGIGLLAQDGSLYSVKGQFVRKWDSQGSLAYEKDLGMRVRDICQLVDGTIVVLVDDNRDKFVRATLMELKGDTGDIVNLTSVMLGLGGLGGYYMGIAAGQEGLLVMERSDGICEIDIKSGSRQTLLSFRNATIDISSEYGSTDKTLHDFRMLENGEAQILWEEVGEETKETGIPWGNKMVFSETLHLVEPDKTVLVLRGYDLSDRWLKEQVAEFNRMNQTYHVMLDADEEDVDEEDFARQTSIEMAAGKGPDILYGNVLGDYEQGVLEKGGFADLLPYVESGMEEQYFPVAFASYRQEGALYGINTVVRATGWMMKKEVLGGQETPDVEALVDALLAWQGEGMYGVNCDEEKILRAFLEGSESLWGMIDWEEGVCDFSRELFVKMLQAAKRYPYDIEKDDPILMNEELFSSFYYFGSTVVQEKTGNIVVGTLFEDGCYAKKQFRGADFMVNANSAHKEGAWEFISFLLGDEAQLALTDNGEVPVKRTAFEKSLEKSLNRVADEKKVEIGTYIVTDDGRIKKGADFQTYSEKDVTEEWVEEYRQAMEEVRVVPLRTESILKIVCQEAQDYFKGIKSAEQVAEIVENRVQLYLDERF